MRFLLDTNICSTHLRRSGVLAHRFTQYGGRLYMPPIVLGELYAWAHRRRNPVPLLRAIEQDLLADIEVVDYDRVCAEQFGRVRGTLLQQGVSVNTVDLMIATVALTHDLTLVTHNTKDYPRKKPGFWEKAGLLGASGWPYS